MMKRKSFLLYLFCVFAGLALTLVASAGAPGRKTSVSIEGDRFLINGIPTFQGKSWQGSPLEGLLPNSRMVQGIFDDLNPETRSLWAYPDTKKWDPDRNTKEFIREMAVWRKRGLLAFTINLQGGSPQGYSKTQPWENSAIDPTGGLRPAYMRRLEKILDRSDRLGMVVILGIFYFGQDERLAGEPAVKKALLGTLEWLAARGYTHVLIEINNECNVRYDHPILQPARVHELIRMAQAFTRPGGRFLVSTSYGGGTIPAPEVVEAADFLLLHGNGVGNPADIAGMVKKTRLVKGYRPKPILFNEDDHFDFDKPSNNFIAATSVFASWGYFDYRMKGESFPEGYQSVPVDWGIHSARKKGFFDLLGTIFGPASR